MLAALDPLPVSTRVPAFHIFPALPLRAVAVCSVSPESLHVLMGCAEGSHQHAAPAARSQNTLATLVCSFRRGLG